MKDLFAKCGCNCGHCPAFKGNAKTDKDRQTCSDGWHRYLGVRLKPDICYCQGCQPPEPWKGGAVLPDRGCWVRPCAVKTGVRTCAHCPSYPCVDLTRRIPGEDFRKVTEERLGAPMSDEDYHSFIEPYEGQKNLAEIRATLGPGDIVEKPDVPPLRARMTRFPDDLSMSAKEADSWRALHGIFEKVLTAPAETFARQTIIKRLKKTTLNVLWVFGRFGELKRGKLVVDGKTHGRRDDLRNIVRRTDNSLHTTAIASGRILEEYGVRFEHVPGEKKDYVLTMSFDKKAGGVEVLKALQRFATVLVERYGEPEYAGASRFRGDAYAEFSRADMRDLKNE